MAMDLVNPQELQCIIYRFDQTYVNVLTQRSTFRKGLMKYNKTNFIITMDIHVQATF
jgi:hypothetical protein